MNRYVISSALLFLNSIVAHATTLPQVPLSELVAQSDVIAFVQIVKGELLKERVCAFTI